MKNTLGRVSQKWKGRVSGVAAGMCAALASLGISDAQTSATINVINNFDNTKAQYTDYFGNYYNDDQVWLYFLNTGGNVTYTASPSSGSSGTQTVTDAVAVKLSAVQNGSFNLAVQQNSTKIFAGLGTSNPFVGSNGPGIFDQNVPYALAEWTVKGNSNDNLDVSYLDSISYPTKMTVTGTNPSVTKFPAGTTAASIISALQAKMPNAGPVGPPTNMPTQGQVGYGPEVGTVSGQASDVRWIGSSKYWFSAPNESNQTSVYAYAPTYNDYLKFLAENAPTNSETGITGWYLDYSGNGGYSGYLTVTGGEDGPYGLQIHDVRINTDPSASNNWEADPTAGDAISGTITIAANGQTVSGVVGGVTTNVTGNFTDIVIYSGADILGNGDFTTGPVITTSGDLAGSEYIPSLIATVSSSMGTGLLGSDLYVNKLGDSQSGGLMYWFATMTREQMLEYLFANGSYTYGGQSHDGLEFYDPYWGTLAELSGLEGYLSPFSDRYSQVSPDVAFGVGYTATWELGVIPEPGTASLLLISALGGAFLMRRGRRVEA